VAERISVCVLAGLTLISLSAAVEQFRLTVHAAHASAITSPMLAPQHPKSRIIAKALPPVMPPLPPVAAIHDETARPAPPAQSVLTSTPSVRAAGKVTKALALPGQTTEDAAKTPELPKMTRMLSPARDMDYGEADRSVSAPSVIVIGRQKSLPMLRDDQAFETWGGEFAGGDSRLKEMIQAGALTSVERGAKVKVLEVRGKLTHIEVNGQGRTGWIRSASLGR
jgi:hypothetical protein